MVGYVVVVAISDSGIHEMDENKIAHGFNRGRDLNFEKSPPTGGLFGFKGESCMCAERC